MGCRGFITLPDVTLENLREIDDWQYGEKVGRKKVIDVCPRGVDAVEVVVSDKDIPNLKQGVSGEVIILGNMFLFRSTFKKRDGSSGINECLAGETLHFGQFKPGN